MPTLAGAKFNTSGVGALAGLRSGLANQTRRQSASFSDSSEFSESSDSLLRSWCKADRISDFSEFSESSDEIIGE
ncbi:MAG: hypothetical protein HDT08_03280 [Bacteroidales bacterium]|nr:hypothetical protein [Bacteroidales bacterium]